MKVQGYLLYRIYYGESIAYIGRTKQPLQNRIRGHLFSKPMHRTVAIDMVTKIEYAELQTEADLNLYEIYYILKEHPPLNVDDKTRDYPTVSLPELEWREFKTPLWEKWKAVILEQDEKHQNMSKRYRTIFEDLRVLRSSYRMGEIGEEEYWRRHDELAGEQEKIRKKLWG